MLPCCIGLSHPVYCNAFPSVIFTHRRHLAARWYRENTTQCVRSSIPNTNETVLPTIWFGRVAFYKTDKTGPLPVHCLLCVSPNHTKLEIRKIFWLQILQLGDAKDDQRLPPFPAPHLSLTGCHQGTREGWEWKGELSEIEQVKRVTLIKLWNLVKLVSITIIV